MEAYAINQDLLVWTNSQIEGHPVFDESNLKWEVKINRNGRMVTIRPSHIVMAIGTFGEPVQPNLKNREHFKGRVLHASQYQGGESFAGKRVAVIGAGNSGIDICQDLCARKAQSVTMIQRSSSCVVSGENAARNLNFFWPNGVPVEYGDFKFGSQSLGQLKKMLQTQTDAMWEADKELYDKLRKGGVALNMGPEGQGQLLLVWERGGGKFILLIGVTSR